MRWKDLEIAGFLHIPGFLSSDELESIRADYADQPVDAGNRNYALSQATERGVGPIRHRVDEVLAAVSANTALTLNHIIGGTYFATKRGNVFKWHQDHESYFYYQNHVDYLNFYIPVFKPVKEKSNLCIVPFDELSRRSPKTFRRVKGGGAGWLYDLGGRQLMMQDHESTTHLIAADIEALARTPELAAGDLLLMRGDIFHRTQDNDTDRVALSIRTTNGQTMIRRSHLADGGIVKAMMMSKNAEHYISLFRAFDLAGRDELTLTEFEAARGRLALAAPRQDPPFRKFLLKEKLRGGVFLSFVRKALSETVVRPAVIRYQSRRFQRTHPASAPARARTT